MTVQTSPLFNSPDTLNQVVFFLKPESSVAFADTCKDARQVVSNFWEREGVSKEWKYCLLSPIHIEGKLSPQFKDLTYKLPYLLSSNGMTFQDKDGALRNAKCVYNWQTSTLFLRVISKDLVEMYAITPCFSSTTVFTVEKEVIANKDYYSTRMSFSSLNRNIWGSKHAIDGNYFSELENATPLKIDPPKSDVTELQTQLALSERFDRENSHAKKFGTESSFLPSWEEVKEIITNIFN